MPEWKTCRYTQVKKIRVLGQVTGKVQCQAVEKELAMLVVEAAGPKLLGRGWLGDLGLWPHLAN